MCPDCGIRPARPRAVGRRCTRCRVRHRYHNDDAVRERIQNRERDRQRRIVAERKKAGPQFFTPPKS